MSRVAHQRPNSRSTGMDSLDYSWLKSILFKRKQSNARINRARIQLRNGQVDDENQANSRSG
jgi:hypothetical protein